MHETSHRNGPGRRVGGSVASVLLASLAIAASAFAAPVMGNSLRADVAARSEISVFYGYDDPSPALWSSQVEWDAGTHASTVATASEDLTLTASEEQAPDPSNPWWDTSWSGRRCYDVDHTAGTTDVTEYPLIVTLDTADPIGGGRMQADAADLRAIAADGATVLPLWIAGPLPSASTEVWVQLDSITAGSSTEFCLYWGNATATSVSDLYEVLTYSTPKPLYVAVSDRFDAPGADIDVVAYVDSTVVSNGAVTSPALARGAVFRFPEATNGSATVISSTGPLDSRGVGSGSAADQDSFDALVPMTWAGTQFVAPTTRDTQHFDVYSPFADATVWIYDGTTPGTATPYLVPAGTAAGFTVDVGGSNTGIVESDVPILVTHYAGRRDAVSLPPTTTEPLYGIRSQNRRIGFATDGTSVSQVDSGGVAWSGAGNRGQSDAQGGGGSNGGNPDDALRVAGTTPIGVWQQADANGNESTTFLPESALSFEYFLPASSNYVAVACPQSGIQVVIGASTQTCTGPPGGPGYAFSGTNLTAGSRIYTPGGEPFYAYYEYPAGGGGQLRDETNLLGIRAGRQVVWPAPATAPRASEGAVASLTGTWTSATHDTVTAGVFGLLDWQATTPSATTVRFQVATGPSDPPSTFVGPDGTVATWFTASARPLDFMHDGDRYLRVRAELSTTDPFQAPRLHSIEIGTDLAELPSNVGVPMVAQLDGVAGTTTDHYVARLMTGTGDLTPSAANVSISATPSIGNATLAETLLEPGSSLQTSIVGGAVVQVSGPLTAFDMNSPRHLVVREQLTGPGSVDFTVTWRIEVLGSTTTVIEDDLAITITAP